MEIYHLYGFYRKFTGKIIWWITKKKKCKRKILHHSVLHVYTSNRTPVFTRWRSRAGSTWLRWSDPDGRSGIDVEMSANRRDPDGTRLNSLARSRGRNTTYNTRSVDWRENCGLDRVIGIRGSGDVFEGAGGSIETCSEGSREGCDAGRENFRVDLHFRGRFDVRTRCVSI